MRLLLAFFLLTVVSSACLAQDVVEAEPAKHRVLIPLIRPLRHARYTPTTPEHLGKNILGEIEDLVQIQEFVADTEKQAPTDENKKVVAEWSRIYQETRDNLKSDLADAAAWAHQSKDAQTKAEVKDAIKDEKIQSLMLEAFKNQMEKKP